jgi:CubicO group peptidase (beta-lactamase class C family)
VKKLFKVLLWLFGIIVLLCIGGFLYLKWYYLPTLKPKACINCLQSTKEVNRDLTDSIYKYTRDKMPNKSSISIAIIDHGIPHYYGAERMQDSLKTIRNSNAPYGIGSITKVFTSTLLAHFILNKEIHAEDNIDTYLGFPLHNNLKINIKSLSNHTSGLDRLPKGGWMTTLANFDNPYISYSDTWMIDYLKNKIEIEPNKKGKSEYSNLGVSILGNVLAIYKKTSYSNLLQNHILSKYGMKNSFMYSQKRKSEMVLPYNGYDGEEATIWDLKSFESCGGLVSNVLDLSLFAIANMNPEYAELAMTQIPTVRIDSTKEVGMGWHIIQTKSGNKVLWHNGATGSDGGYTSSMIVDVQNQRGVIILSNIGYPDIGGNLDKLGFAILQYPSRK